MPLEKSIASCLSARTKCAMPRNLLQHVAADDTSASFAHSCARHEQLCERFGKAFAVTIYPHL